MMISYGTDYVGEGWETIASISDPSDGEMRAILSPRTLVVRFCVEIDAGAGNWAFVDTGGRRFKDRPTAERWAKIQLRIPAD